MRWSRHLRSSYANVASTLALFIALGGTSYAAIAITGKDVKNGSLTGKDLKRSSLTTRQIKNRSLLAADFKPGELPAAGKTGPQGPSGAQGAQGPPGPRGPAGDSPELFENEVSSAVNASQSKVVDVYCPQGTVATGGGYTIDQNLFPPDVPVVVDRSTSLLSIGGIGEGWSVIARETEPANDTPWGITAWVSCAG